MAQIFHIGYLRDALSGEPVEGICLTDGDPLDEDPRYLTVHTDTETMRIPHGRVIAIVEPKETPDAE